MKKKFSANLVVINGELRGLESVINDVLGNIKIMLAALFILSKASVQNKLT